jgi:hypothetical protein
MKNKLFFKKTKKAQMHVEIILSFTLFIGAILMIFIFINPLSRTQQQTLNTNIIQQNIIKEISESVGVVSVITTEIDPNTGLPNTRNCYNLPSEYSILYGNSYLEVPDPAHPRKYTLYFSDELNNHHPNNQIDCPIDTFLFGAHTEEKIVIYNKISEIINNYDADYFQLKETLNINHDFKFQFKETGTGDILEPRKHKSIPQGINVIAKEIPIITIKDTGVVQEVILNIQAWQT